MVNIRNHIKHPRLAVLIIIIGAMLFPVRYDYSDGRTVEYRSMIYSAKKVTTAANVEGMNGYRSGWTVRVLWFEVYDGVKFEPSDSLYGGIF